MTRQTCEYDGEKFSFFFWWREMRQNATEHWGASDISPECDTWRKVYRYSVKLWVVTTNGSCLTTTSVRNVGDEWEEFCWQKFERIFLFFAHRNCMIFAWIVGWRIFLFRVNVCRQTAESSGLGSSWTLMEQLHFSGHALRNNSIGMNWQEIISDFIPHIP